MRLRDPGFKIRDRDFSAFINFEPETSKKSEPQTQSAKNVEIIVQIKQNKMTENASGS